MAEVPQISPCRACPFRKNSLKGYTGPHKHMSEILTIIHYNGKFPCHMRDGYTGAQIVREHWDMIYNRWAAWSPAPGKGNRARKRAAFIAHAHATCGWCGSQTWSTLKRFCDSSCARAYHG
jgi:hypothetical protein